MDAPFQPNQMAAPRAAAADPPPITQPYLLVLFSVPFYLDADGRRWIDGLWAKDLVGHTRYLKRLTLAAYSIRGPAPAYAVAVDAVPALEGMRCVDLPRPASLLSALALLPRTCAILWRELARAKIVHTGVADWPLPAAWLVVPMLWFRRRILYINVESAFWRLTPGEPAGLVRRIRAFVTEQLNRRCVERSDISTFTHAGYRSTLLRRAPQRGHVVEASWIDDGNMADEAALAGLVERRRRGPERLRLVFAGRLTQAKGILVLLDAMAAALLAGADGELDIFGEGPLEPACAERVQQSGLAQRIRLRGSLPYDHRFFEALRNYDALVVPSTSDEQPRVVFDAYSQGVPVIASRTEGLLQCVDEGVTGLLFDVGDARALQDRITVAATGPEKLNGMSRACLARAASLTHRQMHQRRWRLLVDTFPALTRVD